MLVWCADLDLGVHVIDSQHQCIVSLANEVARALRGAAPIGEVSAGLSVLSNYTARHFRLEERLMARFGYEKLDLHREQHGELLGQLDRFAAQVRSGACSAQYSTKTTTFLGKWVVHHILLSDRDMAQHIAEAGGHRFLGSSTAITEFL